MLLGVRLALMSPIQCVEPMDRHTTTIAKQIAKMSAFPVKAVVLVQILYVYVRDILLKVEFAEMMDITMIAIAKHGAIMLE